MLATSEVKVKTQMERWLNDFLFITRKNGRFINKSDVAKSLNCACSSLSQYTNPKHPKKAPWEFQCKFCQLVGKSINELHPELADIRLTV